MAKKKLAGGYVTMPCYEYGEPRSDVSHYPTDASARKDAESLVRDGDCDLVAVAKILYYVRERKMPSDIEIVKV